MTKSLEENKKKFSEPNGIPKLDSLSTISNHQYNNPTGLVIKYKDRNKDTEQAQGIKVITALVPGLKYETDTYNNSLISYAPTGILAPPSKSFFAQERGHHTLCAENTGLMHSNYDDQPDIDRLGDILP